MKEMANKKGMKLDANGVPQAWGLGGGGGGGIFDARGRAGWGSTPRKRESRGGAGGLPGVFDHCDGEVAAEGRKLYAKPREKRPKPCKKRCSDVVVSRRLGHFVRRARARSSRGGKSTCHRASLTRRGSRLGAHRAARARLPRDRARSCPSRKSAAATSAPPGPRNATRLGAARRRATGRPATRLSPLGLRGGTRGDGTGAATALTPASVAGVEEDHRFEQFFYCEKTVKRITDSLVSKLSGASAVPVQPELGGRRARS